MEDLEKSKNVWCCTCSKCVLDQLSWRKLWENQHEGLGPPACTQKGGAQGCPKFGSMTSGLFDLSYIMEVINSCLGGAKG